jgi:hypothetical protein
MEAYEPSPLVMERYIVLEEIQDDARHERGRLLDEEVLIGREPGEGGIELPKTAISRVHGSFIQFRNHWFYKDRGSTNGSWVNGRRVTEGQLALVRPGDLIQLADVALQLSEVDEGGNMRQSLTNFPNLGGRSLIVLRDGQFIDEYNIPEYGRALVIGGSNSDLELEGDLFEMPSLVVERRGEQVCAYSIAKEIPLQLNGAEISELKNIGDGDQLTIANFYILFNDPMNAGRLGGDPEQAAMPSLQPLPGWEAGDAQQPASQETVSYSDSGSEVPRAPKRPQSSVFGKTVVDESLSDDTFALDFSGRQTSHSFRGQSGLYSSNPDQGSLTSLEDKVILGVGFLLLLALVVLVIWWVVT